MPTPTHPAPAPHARGVFRDEHSFAGVVVFRIYDCRGRLVEEAEIAEDWCDSQIDEELRESLRRRCPERCDGTHRRSTPAASMRLI